MYRSKSVSPFCPLHGKPTKRATCRECNAAYMRNYLRNRRYQKPGRAIWERAKKRAQDGCLSFNLAKDSIRVPRTCPVLGMKIQIGSARSASSPSLDRIVPQLGYVLGNIRVISDRANRLKGDRSLAELRQKAERGPEHLRDEYRCIATYLEREQLLSEVRAKAEQGGRAGEEWAKIAVFLDRVFSKSIIK